jgi:hypothetical protein
MMFGQIKKCTPIITYTDFYQRGEYVGLGVCIMAVLVLGGFIIGAIFLYSVINLIRGKE